MIRLGELTFDQNEVLNCVNFMKNSDVIFSGVLSEGDLKKFNFENSKVISKQNNLITFINLEMKIKENDIIYCHLDYLEILFRLLKYLKFKNLIIISTQSDRKVNKKLYDKKPDCVSKWYTINPDIKADDIISIPLGIASYRNTKSVIFEDFLFLDLTSKNRDSIYSNFNLNTNYFHRIKAKKAIKKIFNQRVNENTDYVAYLNNLSSSSYCLAPWGNGYDTHRFWESLYCGTVPITTTNTHYESFSDLPVILLSNYEEISDIDKEYNFFEKDLHKLNTSWWIKQMRLNSTDESNKILIKFKRSDLYFLLIHNVKKRVFNRLKKILLTYLRKIHNKIS